MRRRTFLAAVPAVAVGAALRAQTRSGRASAPAPSDEGTAGVPAAGRREVHTPRRPCRRPAGRGELRLALGGLRALRRRRDRAPAGDAGRDRDTQEGRLGGRCGDRHQRLPGLPRADQQRHRRRHVRDAVGPGAKQGRRPRRIGPLAARPQPRDGAVAGQERRAAGAGRGGGVGAGRGRRLVDAPPALRPTEMGRAVRAGDRLCRGRRAGARGDQLTTCGATSRFPAAGRGGRGDRQRGPYLWQGPGRRRGVPQSRPRAHLPDDRPGRPRRVSTKARSRAPSRPISSASAAG